MDEIELLRKECELNPRHLPSRLELGDLLMEEGEFDAAHCVYAEAVSLKPNYTKAVKRLEQADSAEYLRERGNALFQSGEYGLALKFYDRAIELLRRKGEGDARLHTNRAACLLTAERWVAAASDGVVSIQIDPDWWKGYWYHGQGLLGQLKGKGPSKISRTKAELALRSLRRASECASFPDDKRQRVELLQARARHVNFYLIQNVLLQHYS